MTDGTHDAQPRVCDLTAIPAPARESHLLTAAQIFRAVEAIHEQPDGYALRLPNANEMFMSLARFVENERRCCPFFRFSLEIEPNEGPLWLRLAGGEGVKELLHTLLSEHVEGDALKQLIQTGGDSRLDALAARVIPSLPDSFLKESGA